MVLAEECSRIGAGRYDPDLHLRMGKQQPEQLSACITCGACHCGPYRHRHDYATHNKNMHVGVSGIVRSSCARSIVAMSQQIGC